MSFVPKELTNVAKVLRNGHELQPESVSTLLGWFGAERRGNVVVRAVRNALEQVGVFTDPDFETAFLEGPVQFRLGSQPTAAIAADLRDPQIPEATEPLRAAVSQPAIVRNVGTGTFADPTYRIGKLASANRSPVGVPPDCTIQQASTLMLANDFSQLPVWQNERVVKGVISWASIGARFVLGQMSKTVRECMEPAFEISADDSLFGVINRIVEHQYALVRSRDNRVTGIVTTSDLSLVFQQLSEPFLLLGEIENHVRRLIDGKFTAAELQGAQDPSDGARSVSSVADLTFGEYVRLLEKPQNWERLSIGVDRGVFTNELVRIRTIRNDVMHFDPDGIGDDDLRVLRQFVRFLQALRSMGAT
jgi:CBS domain-containing protein